MLKRLFSHVLWSLAIALRAIAVLIRMSWIQSVLADIVASGFLKLSTCLSGAFLSRSSCSALVSSDFYLALIHSVFVTLISSRYVAFLWDDYDQRLCPKFWKFSSSPNLVANLVHDFNFYFASHSDKVAFYIINPQCFSRFKFLYCGVYFGL